MGDIYVTRFKKKKAKISNSLLKVEKDTKRKKLLKLEWAEAGSEAFNFSSSRCFQNRKENEYNIKKFNLLKIGDRESCKYFTAKTERTQRR